MTNKNIQWYLMFMVVVFMSGLTGCTAIRPVTLYQSLAPDQMVFTHVQFDRVLSKYVDSSGMVDYQALQANQQDLETYYALLASYSPDSHPALFPTANHELAYWLNGYNAAVLTTVLSYYPIESVLDVKTPTFFAFLSDKAGFFFFQRLSFGGKETSLYHLENGVIRKRFEEPRIHFALNCASMGCPRLPQTAFSAELLDQQLDRETRRFISEERNFRIDHYEKVIYLSKIFEWFKKDFTSWYDKKFPASNATLLDYIELYIPKEEAKVLKRVSRAYTIRFNEYDWGLNDQRQ